MMLECCQIPHGKSPPSHRFQVMKNTFCKPSTPQQEDRASLESSHSALVTNKPDNTRI